MVADCSRVHELPKSNCPAYGETVGKTTTGNQYADQGNPQQANLATNLRTDECITLTRMKLLMNTSPLAP